MGKIATESEAASVAGSSTSSLKCCTKAVAQSYGCKVNGTYDSNQLVQYEHLAANVTRKIDIIVKSFSSTVSYSCELTVTNTTTQQKYKNTYDVYNGTIGMYFIPDDVSSIKIDVSFYRSGSIGIQEAMISCRLNGSAVNWNVATIFSVPINANNAFVFTCENIGGIM